MEQPIDRASRWSIALSRSAHRLTRAMLALEIGSSVRVSDLRSRIRLCKGCAPAASLWFNGQLHAAFDPVRETLNNAIDYNDQ